MMANFERVLTAQGDRDGLARARRGREAMRSLSDQQLSALYSRTRVPNLSVAVTASEFLVPDRKRGRRQPERLRCRMPDRPRPQTSSHSRCHHPFRVP
jgi:hypothetical protein